MPRRSLAAALVLTLAGCGGATHHSQSQSHPAGRAAGSPGPHRSPPRTVPVLSLPAHPVARTARVPILTYHRVHTYATELTKSAPDLTVEPGTFAAEVAALSRGGYHSVTQTQLFDALYRGGRLPPKPVLLSFDDGYVDDVTQVLPVLRRYHMVATFYVITGRLHEPGFLTAGQVRELDAAGMDVGAHTRTHPPLAALQPAMLTREVAGSRTDLQRVLGHPVYWFAYPYGQFDQAVIAAVSRAGFLLAVTTQGGTQASALQPFTIPRLHIGRAATPAGVLGLVGG